MRDFQALRGALSTSLGPINTEWKFERALHSSNSVIKLFGPLFLGPDSAITKPNEKNESPPVSLITFGLAPVPSFLTLEKR